MGPLTQGQCASMRAGFASDTLPASPRASALRLKVSAIGRKANVNDCIRNSFILANSEKCLLFFFLSVIVLVFEFSVFACCEFIVFVDEIIQVTI